MVTKSLYDRLYLQKQQMSRPRADLYKVFLCYTTFLLGNYSNRVIMGHCQYNVSDDHRASQK